MTEQSEQQSDTQPKAAPGNDTAKKFGTAGWISLIMTIVVLLGILVAFVLMPLRFAGIKLYEADQTQQHGQ